MTNPNQMNMRGAIDLGALAAARKAQADAEAARANAPAGAILEVTEATFDQAVMAVSQSKPVVVDFWATWCAPCRQLSPILEKLTSEFGGKIVLAKIDSDANPRLSQAFQVQSIPSVFLVINGQVQPLFQGALPEAQVRTVFEKILEVAQQMGLTGEVETETTVPAESQPVEPQIDARFAPAYDALERQDWASARAAFKELLDKNPTDEEAKAGLVQVALLERTLGKDFSAILSAPMANLEDRLLRADVLLLSGELEQSFDLLIAEMAGADSETKATLRDRLIDYFLLVGDCEEVRIGRRKMTNALY